MNMGYWSGLSLPGLRIGYIKKNHSVNCIVVVEVVVVAVVVLVVVIPVVVVVLAAVIVEDEHHHLCVIIRLLQLSCSNIELPYCFIAWWVKNLVL